MLTARSGPEQEARALDSGATTSWRSRSRSWCSPRGCARWCAAAGVSVPPSSPSVTFASTRRPTRLWRGEAPVARHAPQFALLEFLMSRGRRGRPEGDDPRARLGLRLRGRPQHRRGLRAAAAAADRRAVRTQVAADGPARRLPARRRPGRRAMRQPSLPDQGDGPGHPGVRRAARRRRVPPGRHPGLPADRSRPTRSTGPGLRELLAARRERRPARDAAQRPRQRHGAGRRPGRRGARRVGEPRRSAGGRRPRGHGLSVARDLRGARRPGGRDLPGLVRLGRVPVRAGHGLRRQQPGDRRRGDVGPAPHAVARRTARGRGPGPGHRGC